VGKRIAASAGQRQSFGRRCEGNVRADGRDVRADCQSRSLDALGVHPDRIFIVVREIAVRNSGLGQEMSGVADSVRVGVPVDNRARMIRIRLVRVEHGRDASRQQCWNDEAGDERTPRELHVKFGLWWQCERTVKPPAISNVM